MERLLKLYKKHFGIEPEGCVLLPLSGSARKYYRMSPVPAIGCIGTDFKENRAFFAIDAAMRAEGIAAPEIFAVSDDGMLYLQEDLGDVQLFELLKPSIARGEFSEQEKALLRGTLATLPAIQFGVGKGLDWGVCFPDREFNARMIDFDLNYFKYCYLKESGVAFDEIALQDDFDRLRADALAPFGGTFMYRDFQARNIMVKDGRPCFIDFQGGRRGPLQYDLASFLLNAGTHFPKALREELQDVYIQALAEFTPVKPQEFAERYRIISLVRLLQEFGAYGFRGLIEKKRLFIDCIPFAQKILGEVLQEPLPRYPHLMQTLLKVSADEGGICRNID